MNIYFKDRIEIDYSFYVYNLKCTRMKCFPKPHKSDEM